MNFEFHNPTDVIFGPGSVARLGEVAAKYGKKALIVTGGGSVKRSGVFDKAVKCLKENGVAYAECSGIEPNPRITSVRRGAKIAHDEGCDLIIPIGGGSTMDASKAIAAAYYYDGDPWDMIFHGQPEPHFPTKALPIITVPTLAATGSEMNMSGVITNEETQEKSFLGASCLYPKVAVVDPELTLSVPQNQTAFGVCDIITHVTEAYFNGVDGTPIQDRFAARHRAEKFVQFAERIFGLQSKGKDDLDCALAGIDRFEQFLVDIGCPTHFSELDIDGSLISKYAEETLRIIHNDNGKLPARPPMTTADITAVLEAAK